jgi:hypothetical protein
MAKQSLNEWLATVFNIKLPEALGLIERQSEPVRVVSNRSRSVASSFTAPNHLVDPLSNVHNLLLSAPLFPCSKCHASMPSPLAAEMLLGSTTKKDVK